MQHMRVHFVRKPYSLSEVFASQFAKRKDMTSIYIADEVHLTAWEWSDFDDAPCLDREWISNFVGQGYREIEGATPCLRVVNDASGQSVIVDPQGYAYARYVAIDPTGTDDTQTEAQAEKL